MDRPNDQLVATTYAGQALYWGHEKAMQRTARMFEMTVAEVRAAINRWSTRT